MGSVWCSSALLAKQTGQLHTAETKIALQVINRSTSNRSMLTTETNTGSSLRQIIQHLWCSGHTRSCACLSSIYWLPWTVKTDIISELWKAVHIYNTYNGLCIGLTSELDNRVVNRFFTVARFSSFSNSGAWLSLSVDDEASRNRDGKN